jgi:predicted RNA-binding protein YlxR (DUF448 family)
MPYPMKQKNARSAMVELVSECINNALKKVLVSEDLRLDVCMDACDEILRRIDNKGEKSGES